MSQNLFNPLVTVFFGQSSAGHFNLKGGQGNSIQSTESIWLQLHGFALARLPQFIAECSFSAMFFFGAFRRVPRCILPSLKIYPSHLISNVENPYTPNIRLTTAFLPWKPKSMPFPSTPSMLCVLHWNPCPGSPA